jgi:iron-sulfur cluster assembly protein
MAISLTPAAADRVRHFLAERGHGVGLRLGIRKTGCSGYAYVVNYADAIEPGDRVFDSQKLIDGTEVDFVRHGLNEAFRFRNPNVRGECGCGESFSV